MGAALGALRVIRSEGPGLMAKLLDNAAYLRQGFRDLGLRVVEPGTLPDGSEANTPVVPVLVGEDWQAVLLWKALFDAGVYTNVALHPAVPGGAPFPTSLMATHERASRPRPRGSSGPSRSSPTYLAPGDESPFRLPRDGQFSLVHL